MHPRTRETVINVSISLGTIVVFFLLVEFLLRITGIISLTPVSLKIYQNSTDAKIGYELKPNLADVKTFFGARVSTNSLGFRGPELDAHKPTVIVLGDSITFGYGIAQNETLPAHLAAAFPAVNILNTAVPGYGFPQETEAYATKLQKLHPKAIITIFYMGDFGRKPSWIDAQGIMRPQGWTPAAVTCHPIDRGIMAWIPGKCWLDLHSAFYVALKKLVQRKTSTSMIHAAQEEALKHPEKESVTAEQLEEVRQQFARFTVLAPGIPRLFVFWPDHEVHTSARASLTAMATRYGWKVLDLYDTFGNTIETIPGDTVHPQKQYLEQAAVVIDHALTHEKILTH